MVGSYRLQFIVAGRLDPNRTTLRFALSRAIRANATEAGDQLFVDLLPENWKGPPPNLPAEVIADLAARAKKADELAGRNARLKAAEDRNRRVKVRIGEHPTFTRLQFDWKKPPKAKLSRVGNVVTLNFDKIARPEMGRLMADPPKFVRSAEFENADDGLVITLSVDPVMDIRGFREGNSYILDIADPFGLSYANDLAKKLGVPSSQGLVRREPVTEIKSDRDPEIVEPGKKSDRAPMSEPAQDSSANAPGAKAAKSATPAAGAAPSQSTAAAKASREPMPKSGGKSQTENRRSAQPELRSAQAGAGREAERKRNQARFRRADDRDQRKNRSTTTGSRKFRTSRRPPLPTAVPAEPARGCRQGAAGVALRCARCDDQTLGRRQDTAPVGVLQTGGRRHLRARGLPLLRVRDG